MGSGAEPAFLGIDLFSAIINKNSAEMEKLTTRTERALKETTDMKLAALQISGKNGLLINWWNNGLSHMDGNF